jgi:hypothetical protein
MTLRSPIALGLLVGTRFQVLFHSPRRGAFHLSLTVLVHYRSPKVFSLGRWSSQLRTGLACPVLLRCSTEVGLFSPTGLSPSMVRRSRPVRVIHPFFTSCLRCRVLQPQTVNHLVWAAPRSLATTCGIISLPRVTWMFRFSRCPSSHLCIQSKDVVSSSRRVSPFGNSRILRPQTAPRDFSQSTTSFFGPWRQGIHPVPFVAYSRDCS